MNRDGLCQEYFMWMYRLVYDGLYCKNRTYCKLLSRLDNIDFTYILPMDENRAVDGIDLRYRFGRECSYPDAMIASYLDYRPCSVLEMMAALAVRCEEHIMDDMDEGNRTGKWFWDMVANLDLYSMTDQNFNVCRVDEAVDIFLNRKYKPNGEGGLFTLERCIKDLRRVEIWYQMCWYLVEFYE